MNSIKEKLPAYANDLKLNLSSIFNTEESQLNEKQIAGISLASSYATKEKILISAMEAHTQQWLDQTDIDAAKAAASIMAMNNIYYRFVHLTQDSDYQTMPAKLRMNIIAKPGIDKINFELMSLAVSAINGCGKCIDSHATVLLKSELDKTDIQHTIRIASVINGTAQVLAIE